MKRLNKANAAGFVSVALACLMFVAIDWYYISGQSGRRVGLCVRRHSNGISSVGSCVPRNLPTSLLTGRGKIQDSCQSCCCPPHLIECSVRDGYWRDALYTDLPLWPGPPRLPKGSSQHDVLYRELADQRNLENHQRWTDQCLSLSLSLSLSLVAYFV